MDIKSYKESDYRNESKNQLGLKGYRLKLLDLLTRFSGWVHKFCRVWMWYDIWLLNVMCMGVGFIIVGLVFYIIPVIVSTTLV